MSRSHAPTASPPSPRLTIHASPSHASLAAYVAVALQDSGIRVEIRQAGNPSFEECTLQFPDAPTPFDVQAPLLAALTPLVAERTRAAHLAAGELDLWLAGPDDALELTVLVRCPIEETGAKVADSLRKAGFSSVEVDVRSGLTGDRILHQGDASALALGSAAFVLAEHGAPPDVIEGLPDADGPALIIDVLSPAIGTLAPTLLFETDDPASLHSCVLRFERLGFDVRARCAPERSLERAEVSPGALAIRGEEGLIARLLAAAEDALPERDVGSYPVMRVRPTKSLRPRVSLPIRALKNDELHPYAGDSPQRWPVRVYRDDKVAGQKLVEAMKARGFDRIEVRGMPDRVVDGFHVQRGGGAQLSLRLRELVREAIEAVMIPMGVVEHLITYGDGGVEGIDIYAPFDAAASGLLLREKNDPGSFDVTIRADEPEAGFVRRILTDRGFRNFEVEARPPDGDFLRYTTATLEYAKRIRDELSDLPDAPRLELGRAFHGERKTLLVSMTERKALRMQDSTERPGGKRRSAVSFAAAAAETELADGIVPDDLAADAPPFIERRGKTVRIGEHVLDVRTDGLDRVPGPTESFTTDAPTARNLHFLAQACLRGRSVLLVGETGTSKTECVRHFAFLTGRPIWHQNLSEGTQLEDFVGQVGPSDDWWSWKDGMVTQAMKQGGLLLLDEINLAPSAILARLHDVHSKRPALVLQEHETELIEAREGFFFAATCNPATYEGRRVLSPDLIDRFTGLRTNLPGAEAHVAFLRRCVFGETPSIRVSGRLYRGERVTPIHPALAGLPGVEDLLGRFGRFHAEAEAAAVGADQDGLGNAWTDVGPCCFSRRRLIRAIEDIAAQCDEGVDLSVAAARAVSERYFALLTTEARGVVADLAAANGLLDAGA